MPSPVDALQRITVAVTPAVMVSACALTALGLDNQAARMSARLRELAREFRELSSSDRRRDIVRQQVASFDERHRLLINALLLDYGALLSFVATSFLELAAGFLPVPLGLPMLVFAAGVAMLIAMAVFVMHSERRARSAIVLERAYIEAGFSDAKS